MTFFKNSHEQINRDGASDLGASGFASAPAVSSVGFASDEVAVYCDSPHTTSTTAVIVVSRRCFITGISNLLIINDLIFSVFSVTPLVTLFRLLYQKPIKHKESGEYLCLRQRF